jgi:hypothetical protein
MYKRLDSLQNYTTVWQQYTVIITSNCTVLALAIVTFPFKGIVSPDWKGLQMISLDRFEV